MSIRNISDVEDLLHGAPSVRELHSIWERRHPIPDPDQKKDPYGTSGDATQIPWLEDVSLAHQFTSQALQKEEFLLVLDAAREILRIWPNAKQDDRTKLVLVRMDRAAALSRLGFMRDARHELEQCVAPDFQPELGRKLKVDILLQLGHILREEWHYATARAAQLKTAEDALDFCERALEIDPSRIEALVLKAATSFILGGQGGDLRTQSAETARHILKLVKELNDTIGPRHRTTWAEATAHALLGNIDEAARCYQQLQYMPEVTTAHLCDARFQAQFLAEALGKPRDCFDAAFPPLQLIVFAGHLPDQAGGRVRLPQKSISEARDALRAQLKKMGARVGLASAAAGADLLFVEAMHELQGTIHLVLPWSRDEFRRTSVLPYEPAGASPVWEPLYDQALAAAATTREIGQVYEPSSDVGWEFMMEVTAGIALHTARELRLDLQPLVLWDGHPGQGTGGTDSFHAFWSSQLGIKPIVVRPPELGPTDVRDSFEPRGRRCERSIMHQEVKSMLFADIVGYSKLTEQAIPEFIGTFLERVARLVATSKHAPCSVNTWGDAVYAVFDFARDAGLFALELTQMVQEGEHDWLAKGLYWEERSTEGVVTQHPLNIRIGLHTGPVVMHYDPVVGRIGFTGAHANRAARIEPVTKPGQVFASEEFAAMAELSGEIRRRGAAAGGSGSELGFVCEYAGSMQLAKSYPGRYRIYRVVPKRVLALECLAKAAHEAYCEESTAHGDTTATNSSLRRWEELSEDLRDASRSQVADIPNKLRRLGFELAPSHGMRATEIAITDADVEEMAIREHERWMTDRQHHGWKYAAVRDNARKHHPLMVPWKQLSEPEKEKDRDTIRNLPRLVERAGFRVNRIEKR
jgi:class 3 adenylate cyclase/tetratricopeptide (TPR) repeat protein